MTEYLKGNYPIEQPEDEPKDPYDALTDEMERRALAIQASGVGLAGSCCYVTVRRGRNGNFIWNGEEQMTDEERAKRQGDAKT